MAASSSTAGEIKHALQNDCDGLRIALAGGAFDTIIPSASTFVASSSQMAASSSTAGEIKHALQNDCDDLGIALAVGAFDTIIPSASTFDASSSGTKLKPYDVFINHCGQDVKLTLASRIYESLTSTGLLVFLDKDELKYGDLLPKALEEAMATASIYIAIFSEHYAESPWCLAELEYMVKTRKTIIPIFYHVDPADLRWTDVRGAYAKAFIDHEKKARYTPDLLKQWKQALHQASFCVGGIVKKIDDEQRVVKNVVNRVMKEMKTERLHVAEHPVGLDEVVQDFNKFVLQSADSIQIVGIWGMGGSGKTTLAKEIFNKRSYDMDRSSFLSDVRDADRRSLLLTKQKTLLKDIDDKDLPFDNLDEGKQILKNSLSRPAPVLIVLDDVDHKDQLDALLPAKGSLGRGSLIIITTRDKDVVQQWGVSVIYQMKALNAAHAKQLFCWHAFLRNSPPPEFKDLVEEFLNACQGLPLSLKVLGGLLYGKSDNDYWQRTFNKFSQIPDKDIKKTLKISYDALEKEEQEMFLDAACLFIGQRKSAVIEAWDAEVNWDGLLGWESLFNKCLVEEDEDGLVRMHDHLRDLGRHIANGQSPHRLWSPEQIIKIPPGQQEAIRVRGIANAVGDNCYQREGKIIIKTANQGERGLAPSSLGLKIFIGNGEFLSQELSEVSKELIWLQCNKFEHTNLPPWLALKELRILAISDSRSLEHLWTEDAAAPLQLTELVIRRCERLAGFPSSIGRLENLKRILINGEVYASFDALSDLPQEFCYLRSLEHLEMKDCPKLSSLPKNFGKLTKLRHLNLRRCTKLEALPDSFKKLTLLEYLSLQYCRELTIKSELNVFENMTKLRYLNLEGCKKLEDLRLPESVSLRDLHLIETGLKELPANIFHLTKLSELEIGSDFLTTLPTCVGNLSPLTTLTIKGCNKLESLPDSLENLTDLRDLTMEDTGVQCLPKSLIRLQNLTIRSTPISELSFGSWCMLKSKFTSLKKLVLRNCNKLEKIEGLENLISLEELNISRCPELKALPSLGEITSLKTIQLESCNKLEKVEVSTSLKKIGLKYLSKLEKIEGLENIRSLETLVIDSCPKLSGLPDLAKLSPLKEFVLKGCNELKKIESLENITSLQKLVIYECPILDGLQGLAELTSLKEFELKWCKKLEKLESLERLKSLKKLKISECPELEVLPSLPETTSLKEFQLEGCHKLEKVKGLGNIRCLQKLMIYDCPISEGLQGLVKLTSLKTIELQRCNKLEKIENLEHLKSLEELNISDCPELEVLASVPETISLKKIKLERCHKLEKVENFKNIRSLEELTICDCPKLDGLQDLTKLTSLKYIELHKCNKLQKIESLENIRLLQKLKISDCPELEAIASHSETLRSLKSVWICDCPRLGGLLSLAELPSLEYIVLRKCSKLKKLKICNCPQLFGFLELKEFTSLEEFELQRCPKLWRLNMYDFPQLVDLLSLAELPSLKDIYLTNCPKLKKIEGLENIKSLEELRISDSPELAAINITSLKKLELKNCYKLEKIECWKHLKSLEELRLSDCSELEVLSSLAEITSLKNFQLEKCSKLKKMEGLENIKSLEMFKISDCSELEALPEITSLKILKLEKWHNKIEGLENMSSLEELNISDCSELETLPEITSLKILELERCPGLKKIDGLGNMRSLEKLKISDCSELETLPEITSLKRLELERCPGLKKIDGLGNMRSLVKLNISDCSELESLPSLSEITSLEELKLEKCYKLEKVESLERLTLLQKLEVHSCWKAPCIVSLEHSQSLQSLVVVANNISVVEPLVTSIQEWPRNVMICTRPVCDMGVLKNFFQNLPNVSVLDYTDGVEVDYLGRKRLELRAPKSSARGNAILRCFIIDSDHPDLRFFIHLGPHHGFFRIELGEGKWVWMGVSTHFYPWKSEANYISARNREGEDVKVRVEAAWFARGEEESIVDAFRLHFQSGETSE